MICEKQARKYCKQFELIENYEKAIADEGPWVCHHRLETHNSDGTPRPINGRLNIAELKALNMYYNRPPEELIFLARKDHRTLHMKGKRFSEATRKKISDATRGKNHSMFGKHHSEETKQKMSDAKKGKGNPTKGTHWFNNWIISVRRKECPDGFVPGLLRSKLFS